MKAQFGQLRRQPFLSQDYYLAAAARLRTWNSELVDNLNRPDLGRQNLSLEAAQLVDNAYQLFSLRYTAGEPLEQLRLELPNVIEAYEQYQRALAAYEQIPDVAPLGLVRLEEYECCMQLIGLCYLLHRRDLLPRIAALEDPAYAGEDVLYEELLDYSLPGRFETEDLKFVEVYDPLVQAMYADADEEAQGAVAEYVARWYPWFKLAPWHDGHLRINGTDGDYFGYWAFEAGAVALLCDVDDSSIDHLVYPRDLVAWARDHRHLSNADGLDGSDTSGRARLRCDSGQPCPQTGYWLTPAQLDSRRHFNAGDVMPSLGGDYGVTIWQWDDNQQA